MLFRSLDRVDELSEQDENASMIQRDIRTACLQRFLLLICIPVFGTTSLFGQAKLTTVGLQYKPIFPVAFLGTGNQHTDQNGVGFDIGLHSGFNGGMIVRHGFTDLLAIESGINYVKRKYQLTITDSSFSVAGSTPRGASKNRA